MPGSSERTRNELPPPLEPVERPGMVATIKWALQGGNLDRKIWQSLRPNRNASAISPQLRVQKRAARKTGPLDMQIGGRLFRRNQGARLWLRRARRIARVAIDE